MRRAEEKARRASLKATRLEDARSQLPQPMPAEPMEIDGIGSRHGARPGAELDDVLGLTRQLEPILSSPPERRNPALLQPTTSKPSPGGSHTVHSLHHTTPRGTHSATAQYTTAAESPEGETSTARSRRLEAEAARRYRARKDVAANIYEH